MKSVAFPGKPGSGSILVAVLLILVVLMLGGLALSARQRERYKGALAECQAVQALSLAEAGWEDVRVKLDKDPLFPPPGGTEQLVFTYSERVAAADGQPMGSYTVTVDRHFDRGPYDLYLVTCVGTVGAEGSATASRTVVAEVSSKTREVKALRYGFVTDF